MTRKQEQGPKRDELELEPEEIADLEMPAVLADDVRGGRCAIPGRNATVQTQTL